MFGEWLNVPNRKPGVAKVHSKSLTCLAIVIITISAVFNVAFTYYAEGVHLQAFMVFFECFFPIEVDPFCPSGRDSFKWDKVSPGLWPILLSQSLLLLSAGCVEKFPRIMQRHDSISAAYSFKQFYT